MHSGEHSHVHKVSCVFGCNRERKARVGTRAILNLVTNIYSHQEIGLWLVSNFEFIQVEVIRLISYLEKNQTPDAYQLLQI